MYNAYSNKYDIGILHQNKIQNKNNFYLTRIAKKNGKHRYYITKQIIDTIEVEHGDRPYNIYYYDYYSIYIGKNLSDGLFKLLW